MKRKKDNPSITVGRVLLVSYDTSSCENNADFEMANADFMEDIHNLMVRMKTTKFFAYGLSLTWRHVAGYNKFTANDTSNFLRGVAPDTSYTMMIYTTKNKGIYEIITYHHDAPCGETLYLMSQTMAKKQRIMEQYFS
jgi:hypothetical protein